MSNWNNKNVSGWANRTLTSVNDSFEAKRSKAMSSARVSEAANKAADLSMSFYDLPTFFHTFNTRICTIFTMLMIMLPTLLCAPLTHFCT